MNLNATFFAQLVVFAILAWFAAKFVWPPLMRALDERAAKVAESLAAAERGKLEMTEAAKRVQKQLDAAREEGNKRIAEAEQRAQTILEEAGRIADQESARILNAARAEADQMAGRAWAELRAQVAAVAVMGAEEILKREIDRAGHAKMLERMKHEL
ncbi:F0F1 ATP synthase subunit B [Herbaspirillum sp. HC18]|nr:F0F1 ATP synthase subunit B [Herbaspirillum sp. HC18]